jgi:hypothetical protein
MSMLNCSHCLDLQPLEDMKTDGRTVLCKLCAGYAMATFTEMKREYLCEICEATVGRSVHNAGWTGISQRSLICDGCMVQYSKERSGPSQEQLRKIIEDA